MGTLMACVRYQVAEPGASRQTVSELPSATSASVAPAAGRARVTVRPDGSGGSARQDAPGPASATPRRPDRTTAMAPSAPNDTDTACAPLSLKAGESLQCWPSLVQAASRVA